MRILSLCLLLLASPLGARAETRLYMLSQPILQTTEVGNLGVTANVAANWAIGAAQSYTYFAAVHEPYSAAAYAAYQFFISSPPSAMLQVRLSNEALAAWRRRAQLREIAQGAKPLEIRTLTTGTSERTGFYSSRLHSNSFVVVAVEGDQPPPAFAGKEWIPIADPKQTKISLRLAINGQAERPPPIEISLQDLFDQEPLGLGQRERWEAAYTRWQQEQGLWQRLGRPANWRERGAQLWDRFVTKQSLRNEITLSAALVRDGEELDFGKVGDGMNLQKLLWGTKLQRLRRLLSGEPTRNNPLKLRTIAVESRAECSTWFRRFLGREILLSAPHTAP